MNNQNFFRVVQQEDEADDRSVRVTLFRTDAKWGGTHVICGWIAGALGERQPDEVFLPSSANIPASVAIARAVNIAHTLGVDVCIIDRDNLWAEARQD